jgi:two-component system, cell cycle sensor histidine kinase and response regulator CckA
MASPSPISLGWKEQVELSRVTCVSLESLPYPAALVDAEGNVYANNREWSAIRTEAQRCAVVQAGIRAVLGGASERFSQQIEERGNRYSVTITPHGESSDPSVLILLQKLEAPSPAKAAESEKMATVGRLLGGVVHDFANLLTLISGYTEIVLNRLEDRDCLKDELEEIRKAANRGARLTGQLLGFTRGQAAEASVQNVNEIVVGVARMLRPIVGEHLSLETVLAPDLGRIMADAAQMEQVLMNLVLNARDAMPRGGKITVVTRNFEMDRQTAKAHGVGAGSYVMLSVSDTGHGIEPAIADRLWEPLFTTKPEGKGTGLGLSTVRQIIQENRGAVWLRSVVGEGATFFVCLPRMAGTLRSGATHAESPALPIAIKPGNETVLIVEDEEGVRRLLRHVLETRGYRVLEAADGEQALRVCQEAGDAIDLVLTDMVMPRMGGRELAQRLESLRPGARIVFMSGYTDDVLVHSGELGRGMSFLQKPLRPEVLAAKVREALDSPARPFNPS